MSSLKRTKSGAFKARKALPSDIRAEYQTLYGPGWEAIFSKPASMPVQQAKALHAQWLAEIELRITALRSTKDGKGRDLSQKQAHALAGEWYREFTARHEDNPGHPNGWDAAWSKLTTTATEASRYDGETDAEYVREDFPWLAKEASRFLTDKGETLTAAAADLFLTTLLGQAMQAAALLERRAGGDYSPAQHLDKLPTYQAPATSKHPKGGLAANGSNGPCALTAVELFEAYCKDKNPKRSTIGRWKPVFPALDAMEWKRVGWDAQRWADSLVGTCAVGTSRPRGARSVRETWIAAPRAVWKWAQRKRLVTNNPFVGIAVDVPRKAETRETGKALTDVEASAILQAALSFPIIPRTQSGRIVFFEAAKRWVPWLAAYTGARVGELTQLRVQDIEHRPCGYVLRITPEAGTVKTNKVRVIPLHPHLIEMGLSDYVGAVKDQQGAGGITPLQQAGSTFSRQGVPLFNAGERGKGRGPAPYTSEKLATWVRTLASHCPSLADKDLQPNHCWRHTFKQRARRAGIEAGIRDAICGHTLRSSAERYEQHVPVEEMVKEMKKFPRYEVE